jgi:hypothetical protein
MNNPTKSGAVQFLVVKNRYRTRVEETGGGEKNSAGAESDFGHRSRPYPAEIAQIAKFGPTESADFFPLIFEPLYRTTQEPVSWLHDESI